MTAKPMALDGEAVLVTGASGFIGRRLCSALLANNAEVHAVSRSGGDAGDPAITCWARDLSEFEATNELVEKLRPSYVFHLASHVKGAPDLRHVLPTFRNNLATTVNLLTALAETDCKKIILTGSLVEPPAGEMQSVPAAPYAAAKWSSSHYGRMFHALYGLPVSIARLFMVYGPGTRDDTKLVPYVIRQLDKGKAPKVSSGQHLIDWVYVDDVVEGFLAMANAKGIDGKSVDIGSGELISTKDLVCHIACAMNASLEPQFGSIAERPMETVRVADVDRSFEMIGWKPRVTLEEGLKRSIEYFAA
jgi:nucleoside-diphosphate-sugar epimerase